MRYLLDTHVALWVLGEPERLGWDKLDQPPAVVAAGLDEAGVDLLGLTVADVLTVGSPPAHHRDPFDRMIVAQARVGAWTVGTGDAVLAQYGVPVMQA